MCIYIYVCVCVYVCVYIYIYEKSERVSCSVMSDSLQPHGLKPTGLFCLWNSLQARILEWVAIPFASGSSQPGIEPRSPALQADSIPSEPPVYIQTHTHTYIT